MSRVQLLQFLAKNYFLVSDKGFFGEDTFEYREEE
jgi:hypothetical protein